MKLITMLSFMLSILLLPGHADADFGKTKIAVLDFQLQGDKFANDDMGAIVAEWFITAMVNAGRFDMVERSLLQTVLSEQKLVMTGMVDAGSATKIGKLLGAKVIITGSVMHLGDMFEINARMIDVESTSIISAEHEKTSAIGLLQDMVVSISKKMIGKFPLEGFVVNRTAQEISIDLSIHSGVQEGMRFIVFKQGQVIKHPMTGEILDVERIETGTAIITAVMEKISKARINREAHLGAIEYGQFVKSLAVSRVSESRLSIDTSPASAQIRILNITPPYQPGMVLTPGSYQIEVSADGYQTVREWIQLGIDEEKSIVFNLSPAFQAKPQTKAVVPVGTQSDGTVHKEIIDIPRATMGAFNFILSEGWIRIKDTDLGDIYVKLDKNGNPHAMVQFHSEIIRVDRQSYERNVIAELKEYKADRINIAGSKALQLSSYSEESGTIFFIFPYDRDGLYKVTIIYKEIVHNLSSQVLDLLATVNISKHPQTDMTGSMFKDSITGMEFVLVPGGCFQMGDIFGDGHKSEKPVHEACLDSFYAGKYEVTQGEYRRVTNENPSQIKKGDDLPVESVSWDDAQTFIEQLNSLSGSHYRLPTEAEWEYSARSGGKKEMFAGGNDVSAYAWYIKNSGGSIKPGGGKRPNGLGLYDMSGNVNEWCHDWASGKYDNNVKVNPNGPSSGSKRVVRGGAGNGKAEAVRTSRRAAGDPGKRTIGVGFRLVHPAS